MLGALNDGGDARPGSPITADSWAAKASPTPNRPISAGFIPARPGGGEPRCWSRRPGTVGPHPGFRSCPGANQGPPGLDLTQATALARAWVWPTAGPVAREFVSARAFGVIAVPDLSGQLCWPNPTC